MRRISGIRNFEGRKYGLTTLVSNRSKAKEIAETVRKSPGRYNVRVVPLKSLNGYGLYVGKSQRNLNRKSPPIPRTLTLDRSYNRIRVPWREFEDATFGIDQVELRDWLSQQDGYNTGLDWRQNLRILAGQDAYNNLVTLTDPQTQVQQKALDVQAGFKIGSLIDDLFADTDMAQDMGFERALPMTSDQQIEAGGLGFDMMVMEDGSNKDVSEIDIYELLGIDDGVAEQNDDELYGALDNWFDNEIASGGMLLPENIGETRAEINKGLRLLTDENAESKSGIGLDAELDSIVFEAFRESLFSEEGSDTVVFGDKEFSTDQLLSSREQNPSLGNFQPEVPEGLPPGYWSFRPLGARGGLGGNFDTKPAFLVVDSMGVIITGAFYDEDSEVDLARALRGAYDVAKNTSRQDNYSKSNYMDYDRFAPGIAVIDSRITIDESGAWAGYDIDRTDDNYRLTSGDYRYFLDGREFEPGDVDPTVLRNWILPQRVNVKQTNQERAEFLNVDFEGLNSQAQVVSAEIARKQGASPEQVLDIMLSNQYRLKDSLGTPITTFLPSYEVALKQLRALNINGQDVEIFSAPSDQGRTIITKEVKVADAKYDPGRDEYGLFFTGDR
tara:strand:+ start:20570 stop:22408 length:1839 start_codon:yes stop_codon:yes gene_type:complete